MVDSFDFANNRMIVTKDGKTEFDTSHPSLLRLPDSTHIKLTNQSITFPSYLQRKAYYRREYSNGLTECELWSTLVWQEWGPTESNNNPAYSVDGPITRNLPRTLLGTVPAETTYLDIRVDLQRTTTPPPIHGLETPMLLFESGDWVTLPGGSCPAEIAPDIAVRLFNIVRIGNSIYLERFQSVRNADTALAPGGYVQANLDTNQSGWNSLTRWSQVSSGNLSDGSNGEGVRSNYFLYGLLQSKGPDTNGNKRPGSSNSINACDVGGAFQDLTTVLTGSIEVVPCIHKTS